MSVSTVAVLFLSAVAAVSAGVVASLFGVALGVGCSWVLGFLVLFPRLAP